MPLPDIQSRPSDAIELKTMYESGGAYDGDTISAGGSIAAQKTATIAATDAIVDDLASDNASQRSDAITGLTPQGATLKSSLSAGWPYANLAAFQAAFDTHYATLVGSAIGNINLITFNATTVKSDIASAINTNITGGGGTVPIADALQQVYEDYSELVQAESFTYPCPQCATTGLAPIYDPTGATIVHEIKCPLCTGYGYTDIAYKRNPNGTGYVPV